MIKNKIKAILTMWLDDCLAAEEYYEKTNTIFPNLKRCMDIDSRELIGNDLDFLDLSLLLGKVIKNNLGYVPAKGTNIIEVGTPGGHQILAEYVECYYLINDYLKGKR